MVKFEEIDDSSKLLKELLETSFQLNKLNNCVREAKDGINSIDESMPDTYQIPFWMTFTLKIINESKDHILVEYNYKYLSYELKSGKEELKEIKNVY